MKKLILTLFILGFVSISHAQTQSETEAWIKEKLEKYGTGNNDYENLTNVKVSPCNISFTRKDINGTVIKSSFNPSHTKSWRVVAEILIAADAKIII